MDHDIRQQLNEARHNIYIGHHPALMSWVWRQLLFMSNSTAPMFLLHTGMAFIAYYNFMQVIPKSTLKMAYPLLFLIPALVVFSVFVWKDVGMAFSFLLAASILTKANLQLNKLNGWQILLIIVLFIYGGSVKYQGQYVVSILVIWLTITLFPTLKMRQVFVRAAVIYSLIFASITVINVKLVSKQADSHSWQFVKIFDLTAISLALNQPLYPEYMKNYEKYSFTRIKELFTNQRIDEVAFRANSPVARCQNDAQRQQLWQYWFKTVLKHPLIYVKHRLYVLGVTLSDNQYLSFKIGYCPMNTPIWKCKILKSKYFVTVQVLLQELTMFKWYLPLSIAYLVFGLTQWSRQQAAKPLVFMNATGLMMVLMLLFLSMAGVQRYIFISAVMFHFSHPFAYMCLSSRKTNKKN